MLGRMTEHADTMFEKSSTVYSEERGGLAGGVRGFAGETRLGMEGRRRGEDEGGGSNGSLRLDVERERGRL